MAAVPEHRPRLTKPLTHTPLRCLNRWTWAPATMPNARAPARISTIPQGSSITRPNAVVGVCTATAAPIQRW